VFNKNSIIQPIYVGQLNHNFDPRTYFVPNLSQARFLGGKKMIVAVHGLGLAQYQVANQRQGVSPLPEVKESKAPKRPRLKEIAKLAFRGKLVTYGS
jgi:hypothetical protein